LRYSSKRIVGRRPPANWVFRRMGRPQSFLYLKFGQASTLLANLIKLFGVNHARTGAPKFGLMLAHHHHPLSFGLLWVAMRGAHWIILIRICLETPFLYVEMFILCEVFNRYHRKHASPGQHQPTQKHSQMNTFGVLIPWYTNPTLDNPSLTELGFILWQTRELGHIILDLSFPRSSHDAILKLPKGPTIGRKPKHLRQSEIVGNRHSHLSLPRISHDAILKMQNSSTNGPNDNTASLHPRFTQLVPRRFDRRRTSFCPWFPWGTGEIVSDSEYILAFLFRLIWDLALTLQYPKILTEKPVWPRWRKTK
jgi:hypothetical protein